MRVCVCVCVCVGKGVMYMLISVGFWPSVIIRGFLYHESLYFKTEGR